MTTQRESKPSEFATLPGNPGKSLRRVYELMGRRESLLLTAHLLGGTSAAWIARTLTENGYPIGATAIKEYRARLRKAGTIE